MRKIIQTSEKYVRCEEGRQTYFTAIFMDGFRRVRVTKRKFDRAHEARIYHDKILERLRLVE